MTGTRARTAATLLGIAWSMPLATASALPSGMTDVETAASDLPTAGKPFEPSAIASRPDTRAAGGVRGVVRDASTGEPLVGVNVRVAELQRGEITHHDGAFHIPSVPPGAYTLVFERLGYRTLTRSITVGQDEVLSLQIRMEVSALQLSGMVVTGTVGARSLEEALRPTNVISGQELARQLEGTVAATLQKEAGLASASMGPATARPVIRGLSGDRILVLEDGERPGDLSAASPDHAVAIDPISAERIEVVRGPAALLYGSNALGGVVNVVREEIPRSRSEHLHGTASVQGQTVNSSIAGEGSLLIPVGGPLTVRLEGSLRNAGNMRTPAGRLPSTSTETLNLSAGAGWINGWGHFGGAYRFYDSSYGLPGGFLGAHPEGVRVEMTRHALRGETRLLRRIGPFSDLEVDASYTRYHHREIEPGGDLGTEFGLLTGVTEVVGRHDAFGPFARGAAGVRGEWRDLSAGGSLNTTPATEYSAAAYLLEEIERGRLHLQFGGRFDYRRVLPERDEDSNIGQLRTRSFAAISGSVGALFDLTGDVALGASVARAFRTPDMNELFSEGPHLAAYSFEVGNPELKEEVGLGVDVFLRASGPRLRAELAGFINHIDDFIYPRNTGEISRLNLPVYQFANADALLRGFELAGEWNLVPNLVVDGAVSYVWAENTATDTPLPLIPPLSANLSLRFDRRAFFVSAGWRGAAEQTRVGEFEETTDGYGLLDASAGYRWTVWGRVHSLTLRVDNLTDTEHRNHLSRVRVIMPEPGRSVSVLYRLMF